MSKAAKRMDSVVAFRAMSIFSEARKIEAKGGDVIHHELGEPATEPPPEVIEQTCWALRHGHSGYTSSAGLVELRQALANKYKQEYAVDVDIERIVITAGSSLSLYIVAHMLIESGDEVIIPSIAYPSYKNLISASGGQPVYVDVYEDEGFNLSTERIKKLLNNRTKALIFCSPDNPTGAVCDAQSLQDLSKLGITLIADEAYHGLNYYGRDASILSYTENAFVVGSFSKYYSMTGWRIGYLIMPKSFIDKANIVHQYLALSASEFAQHGALAALKVDRSVFDKNKLALATNREYVIEQLEQMGIGLKYQPQGAFYCFTDVSKYTNDTMAFALDLLHKEGVALSPGIDFGPGGKNYIRISYATDHQRTKEGMARLSRYLKTLAMS